CAEVDCDRVGHVCLNDHCVSLISRATSGTIYTTTSYSTTTPISTVTRITETTTITAETETIKTEATTITTQTTIPECVDLHLPGQESDCPRWPHLCNDPTYYALMTQQCPFTCGRCPGGTTMIPGCVDLHLPGQASDCPRLSQLCDNPIYYQLMTQQCPFTCRRCPGVPTKFPPPPPPPPPQACFDLVGLYGTVSCISVSYLCQDLLYYHLMMQQCPQTCGYC
ncbi:unnamed protein product, partial [Onchocerca ochengi]